MDVLWCVCCMGAPTLWVELTLLVAVLLSITGVVEVELVVFVDVLVCVCCIVKAGAGRRGLVCFAAGASGGVLLGSAASLVVLLLRVGVLWCVCVALASRSPGWICSFVWLCTGACVVSRA